MVLDNLIAAEAIPPCIGVFINPGSSEANPRQRSFEYDSMTPLYSRFLLDELLPLVQAEYKISSDPVRRAICGASSGGIAAFTAAWFTCHAAQGFARVIAHVGSFTNIRGGHNWPWLVRNNPRKPIVKIHLQGTIEPHSTLYLHAYMDAGCGTRVLLQLQQQQHMVQTPTMLLTRSMHHAAACAH